MKTITIEISFDDKDCYKGHGDNTVELIKNVIDTEIEMQLENDGVIKKGWVSKVIESK